MDINVTQIIIAVIGLVFTGVIIPLIKTAFDWLKNKTENEALKSALEEAQIIADNVVAQLGASIVEGFKANSEDGKLTKEEAGEVLDAAVTLFYNDISTKSVELLENNAENIREWIEHLIEQRLLISKK